MAQHPTEETTKALAAWYRSSARVLPWRVSVADWERGVRPDPYRVWVSEMMLQQTTVATVKERYAAFLEAFPSVAALAVAPQEAVLAQWAGLGYYNRARNLHKAAARFAVEGFPTTAEALQTFPGIGAYASAAIASIAFDSRAVVVDGNVERVMTRLFGIKTPLPQARKEIVAAADALTPAKGSGHHAQAVMDLAAQICRPRDPACLLCPVAAWCAARTEGNPALYPVKPAKTKKPTRYGMVGLGRQGSAWLLERRPQEGLLAGMLGLPGGAWGEAGEDVLFPAPGSWQHVGQIKHSFTHFHLVLDVYAGVVDEDAAVSNRIEKTPMLGFAPTTLPTVMRKAFDKALPFF